MKESLTSRVGRIIGGSLNALVDAVENMAPETVMEQAIREIDGAIDEVRAELGKVVASKHLANTRLMEENRRHQALGEKIELALGEGREELAEAAVAQQLDIEAQLPVLESRIADLGGQEKELEAYVQALQAKKREMNDELRQFREVQAEAQRGAVAVGEAAAAGGSGGAQARADKAASAFDRVMEKSSGVPGAQRPDAMTAARLAELDELARKNRIQERMQSIKRKLAGNG